MNKINILEYKDKQIRVQIDENNEDYYYSLVDVISVLTNSKRPEKYWSDLKNNFKRSNPEYSDYIGKLKLPSKDGKMRSTDVSNSNQLIHLLKHITSKNTDEFQQWLISNHVSLLNNNKSTVNTLLYNGDEGAVSIEVILDYNGQTMWATQKTISELFKVTKQDISYHLQDIFSSGELSQNSVVKEILTTASDGKQYPTSFYNLDVIISLGYRVNSKSATQFRIWATHTLNEYIVKGYVLDDELLKNGTRFGRDYFDELLERIREIRSSERRFNQKITDIYATSFDYNKDAKITRQFFATVQNKLIYAVSGMTAAEIIASRSDSKKPHMGLTTWKNINDKILQSDVVISKNYLNKNELEILNNLVDGFLTLAENRARNKNPMAMKDWMKLLEDYINLNLLPKLVDKGKISSSQAKQIALEEYMKFKVVQDSNFVSDFDEMIEEVKRLEGL